MEQPLHQSWFESNRWKTERQFLSTRRVVFKSKSKGNDFPDTYGYKAKQMWLHWLVVLGARIAESESRLKAPKNEMYMYCRAHTNSKQCQPDTYSNIRLCHWSLFI